MRKFERQKAIRKLIQQYSIDRQEDIVKLLQEQAIKVTQATVSRDVKELQLVKLPAPNGGYQYSLPAEKKLNAEKKLKKTLHDAYLSSRLHESFFLIKLLPGNGPAVASLIDQLKVKEIFGSLGDDDTVLVIAQDPRAAKEVQRMLLEMVS
ncbi:arginine repressor [Liquorilactobacillus vini]|nr:arginine repressor [Liquorilactobacillus vini]